MAQLRQTQERRGLFFAILCALDGAFVPAMAKLTTATAEPIFVATATSLTAGVCAGLALVVRHELSLLVCPRIGPQLVIIGALGTAAAYLLFFLGASRASAIEAVLCLQSEPVYALILAWLVLGHRPTIRRVIANIVLLSGIFLALGGANLEISVGVWILLATPLCLQLSHLIVLRGLVGIAPAVLTGARYIYGGALLTLIWALGGGLASMPAAHQLMQLIPLLALQGIVLSYGGTLLWYQAIARLDLARATAIVVPLIPLLSLLASFVLLGELPSAQQGAGLVLAMAGVLAFVTAPNMHMASQQRG